MATGGIMTKPLDAERPRYCAMVTECCGMAIGPDCRFCPKCGQEARVKRTEPQRPAPGSEPAAVSELGEFWVHWFHCVGAHAVLGVVHATTDLVLAEREIAVRDHLEPIRAAVGRLESGSTRIPAGSGHYRQVVAANDRVEINKSAYDALVALVKGEK